MESPKIEEEKQSEGNSELQDYFETRYGYWTRKLTTWCSGSANAEEIFEVSRSRISTLKEIMDALTDPNIYTMGVWIKDNNHTRYLLQRVIRRAKRDNLFGVIGVVSIGKKPNLRRIQEEIARELGLSFQEQEHKNAFCVFSNRNSKAIAANARQLSDRFRREPNILLILCDLQTRIDLAKLGIPFDVNHKACKMILTSTSEELLSSQMKAQRTFKD